MKKSIHPSSSNVSVNCSGCNTPYTFASTMQVKSFSVESCCKCHSAYTGKRRITSTGAVEKFSEKYKNYGRNSQSKKPATKKSK